jgi:hypothetical protein
MLAHLRANATGKDDAELISIFERHRESIAGHYESCDPGLPHNHWMNWVPTSEVSRADLHGPYFHEGFKQIGITGKATDDKKIWKILSTAGDTRFWDAHAASMQGESDFEMLMLAAKALGIHGKYDSGYIWYKSPFGDDALFNSLEKDDDTLRIEETLKLTTAWEPMRGGWSIGAIMSEQFQWLAFHESRKRASTMAAAAIGKLVTTPIDQP